MSHLERLLDRLGELATDRIGRGTAIERSGSVVIVWRADGIEAFRVDGPNSAAAIRTAISRLKIACMCGACPVVTEIGQDGLERCTVCGCH